jgi:hypothetical protein
VATRVQKTTAPKPAQTSLWPKLRDPPAPKSPSKLEFQSYFHWINGAEFLLLHKHGSTLKAMIVTKFI